MLEDACYLVVYTADTISLLYIVGLYDDTTNSSTSNTKNHPFLSLVGRLSKIHFSHYDMASCLPVSFP